MRAVYDCMLFVQAVTNGAGIAFKCFRPAEQGAVDLMISSAVLAEVNDVLSRPELRAKFKTLTPERVAKFLARVLDFAEIRANPPKAFSLPRDPDDEAYLDLAIAAKANYLVTWNDRHLTYLMRQDTPEGRDFCQRFPDVTILDPVSFVRKMEQKTES